MPKDTSTASTPGRHSTNSLRSSNWRVSLEELIAKEDKGIDDDVEREYKEIDDIKPGDVVAGPTPGLQKSVSAWHPQIVLGKTSGDRLKTVMVTSLGLDERGRNLRYFVPLEPRKVDPAYEEFKQPNVVIKYADNSAQLPKAQWALVAKRFKLRPLPDRSDDAGKYVVVKGVRISDDSVTELNKIVDEKQIELDDEVLSPAGESRAGKAEPEQELAPKALSGEAKKIAMQTKSWRQGDESAQKPHSAGGESTGAQHNNRGPIESAQNAPQSGGGASKVSFNPSGETRTPAHGGGAQGDSSRSFARVASAPPPPPKAQEKKTTSSGMKVFRRKQASQPPPEGNGNPSTAGSSKK